MRIYVTDGNNRACLAITRSLGKKGHQVFVGENKIKSLAGSSRYCYKSVSYKNPLADKEGFIEDVIEQLQEHNIDVIIPVADITSFLLIENRERITQFSKLPFGDYSSIQHAADKKLLIDIANKLNIPIPKTIIINSADDFYNSAIELPYPLVVKPSRSRVRTDTGWVFTTVTYAQDLEDLTTQIKSKNPAEFPILLQEKIDGPGVGVFTCFNHGSPIAMFSHKRLREKPPSGGVSVLRESIPIDPIASRVTKDLLQHINWHGVAMVEFKIDSKDNLPKLIEINGRFWGSLQLAIDAGVDFPDLLVKTLENESIQPITNYKIGVKSRWLLGDFDLLLILLLKSRKSLNLPNNYPGRIRSILLFLKFWGKNQRNEVLRLNDINPFIFELKKWLIN